jgi:hypothetical protein
VSGNGIGGGDMVTVYSPGDKVIILDSLGRAYVYVVRYDGSLMTVSEPDSTRNLNAGEAR